MFQLPLIDSPHWHLYYLMKVLFCSPGEQIQTKVLSIGVCKKMLQHVFTLSIHWANGQFSLFSRFPTQVKLWGSCWLLHPINKLLKHCRGFIFSHKHNTLIQWFPNFFEPSPKSRYRLCLITHNQKFSHFRSKFFFAVIAHNTEQQCGFGCALWF